MTFLQLLLYIFHLAASILLLGSSLHRKEGGIERERIEIERERKREEATKREKKEKKKKGK